MNSHLNLSLIALLICLTNFAHGGKKKRGSDITDGTACDPGAQLVKRVTVDHKPGCRLCQCHEDYGWVCTEKAVKCVSKLCEKRKVTANEKLIDCYKCSCSDNGLLRCDAKVTGLKGSQCREKLSYNTFACIFCEDAFNLEWDDLVDIAAELSKSK